MVGLVQSAQCYSGCLKLQRLIVPLSQGPAEVAGVRNQTLKCMQHHEACWIKTSKQVTVITSGGGGWRGNTLSSSKREWSSVEGPVSMFIDAGVVREQLGLFGQRTATYGLRCFSQHALERVDAGHDTAGRPSAFWPMWPHGSLHHNNTRHPTRPDRCQASSDTLPCLAWVRVTPGCCE